MRSLLCLGTVLLLVAGPVSAQTDPLAPDVEFPDIEHDEPVPPTGRETSMLAHARIDCPPDELPPSETIVTFAVEPKPEVYALVSPSEIEIPPQPEACAEGMTHNVTTAVLVSPKPDARAFEPIDVELAMNVTRGYPQPELNRTYGPYTAKATFTTGFDARMDLRLQDKSVEIEEDEQARYRGSVQNLANGPATVTFSGADVPEGASLGFSPESLNLAPGETGSFTVMASNEGAAPSDGMHAIAFDATLRSTDRPDAATASEEASVLMKMGVEQPSKANLEASSDQENGAPAPSAVVVGGLMAGIAAARSRP